jgi:HPt (histidine-containing phosphotransfer) domain-containing protein
MDATANANILPILDLEDFRYRSNGADFSEFGALALNLLPQWREQLSAVAQHQNRSELANLSHSICGALSTLGAKRASRLEELARSIEPITWTSAIENAQLSLNYTEDTIRDALLSLRERKSL